MKLTLRMNAMSNLIEKAGGTVEEKKLIIIIGVSNEGDFYALTIYKL